MKYYTIPPSPHLAAYVRYFWVLESEVKPEIGYVHRSMADGCVEILFHYEGSFTELTQTKNVDQAFSLIHGPSSEFRRFSIKENFGIFGAYLYPFALTQLFGLPASELSNQMPDLETLLGLDGSILTERIMLASNNQERVLLLSNFLENCLKDNPKSPPIFTAINHIIWSQGTIKLPELASQACLSMRQFERNFKNIASFSPKLFSRIIRFQAALQHYNNTDKSLTQIAHEAGYYDQSHFIHDFKAFSGHNPKSYFYKKAEGTEYRNV